MKQKLLRLLIATILTFSISNCAVTPNSEPQPTPTTTPTENDTEQPTQSSNTYLTPAKNLLSDVQALTLSFMITFVTGLILLLINGLIIWTVRKDKGLVILPFDILTDQPSQNGEAIADSLIFELQRISQIHQDTKALQGVLQTDQKAKDLKMVQSERLPWSLPITTEILKELAIEPERLDTSITDAGTLSIGGITVSLGGVIFLLKQTLLLGGILGDPGTTITGSLQKYGSILRLVVRMQDQQVHIWEASSASLLNEPILPFEQLIPSTKDQQSLQISSPVSSQTSVPDQRDTSPNNPSSLAQDEQIPELIRDIAFQISKDLSKHISAKDWKSFKHFTEALNHFNCFRQTRKIEALDSAKCHCLQALDVEPNYGLLFDLVRNLGIAYLDQADYSQAREMFDQALQLKPNNPLVIAGIAAVESRLGFHDEALNDINYAINKIPEIGSKASVFAQRGSTYSQLGEADRLGSLSSVNQETNQKALNDFTTALEQLPPDEQDMRVFILSRRGAIYSRLGQYDNALTDLNNAIALKPHYAWAIASRGVTRLLMGKDQYQEVIDDLTHSLRLNPNLFWAYANRGETYRQLEKYDKAIADFDRSINLDPTYALAIASRGLTYFLFGKYKEALEDFNQCLKLNPQLDWVWAKRGLTHALLKQFENARNDISHAIELTPDRDWFRYNRALIYLASNQPDLAQHDLNEAIRLSQQKWDAHSQDWRNTYNLAIYQLAAGKPKVAEAHYHNALKQKAPAHFTRIAICDLKCFLALLPKHAVAQEIMQWLEKTVPNPIEDQGLNKN
jgi:tetratricopeptide (TPR) repeat protein